jgi:segregation and condensation protein A
MANALAQRLRRLEGIRQVAEQLMTRPQLGRDVFGRGDPEPIAEITKPEWTATLYDLLSAYSSRRQTKARSFVRVRKRTVWSLAEARVALEKLVGQSLDWSPLDQYLIAYLVEPSMVPTVLASTFAAALELIREGHIEAHQQGSFTPLYLRKKQGGDGGGSTGVISAESGNA